MPREERYNSRPDATGTPPGGNCSMTEQSKLLEPAEKDCTGRRIPPMARWFLVLLTLAAFIPPLLATRAERKPRRFVLQPRSDASASRASFRSEELIRPAEMSISVHSAALAETNNGEILAVWYGGTGEGRPDVSIYSSRWSPQDPSWTPVRCVVSREGAARDLDSYIKKIGNPALVTDRNGRMWLFFVTVTVGGWSGSSVNFQTSDDGGRSWTAAKRMIFGPFLNLSTLVKGQPVLYSDGTIGLPIYHELVRKFPELARIGPDGEVLDKQRLDCGRSLIQPWVTPLDATRAIALMRHSVSEPGQVHVVRTSDGGESWSEAAPVNLPNRDSAIASVREAEGTLVAVYNNSDLDRSDISLARSKDDGRSWSHLLALDHDRTPVDGKMPEFSYPWLLAARDGTTHLVYTHRRTGIKHVWFNSRWVEQQ